MNSPINYIYIYVTGFWKTDQIVTLGLFNFIGLANGYTRTLHIHSNGYTCTLHIHSAITIGLVNWSAFLEQILPTRPIHN